MYLSQDEDDAGLVRQSLGGDQQAFELLLCRYQRVLFNVALRMLGNQEDARDATQNTFVKVYERLGTFDPTRRFFSWIYRILVNECLNVIRARRPHDPLSSEVPVKTGPFEALEAAERRRSVQSALLELSPEYREVVVLRHFAALSYEEMSEALGIPAKTVKSRLYSARQRLGQLLLGWNSHR